MEEWFYVVSYFTLSVHITTLSVNKLSLSSLPYIYIFKHIFKRAINLPLHVTSITCSSLGGATQTTLGILRVCYVSCLHQDWSGVPLHSTPLLSTPILHAIYQVSFV
jgi:hypothetical protein